MSPAAIETLRQTFETAREAHTAGDGRSALAAICSALEPFAHVTVAALAAIDRHASSSIYAATLSRKLDLKISDVSAIGAACNLRGVIERAAERPDDARASFLLARACGVYTGLLNLAETEMYDRSDAVAAAAAAREILAETYDRSSIYLRHEGMFYVYKVYAFASARLGDLERAALLYQHIARRYRSRADLRAEARKELAELLEAGGSTALQLRDGELALSASGAAPDGIKAAYNDMGLYKTATPGRLNRQGMQDALGAADELLAPVEGYDWRDLALDEEQTWYLGRAYLARGRCHQTLGAAELAIVDAERALEFTEYHAFELLGELYGRDDQRRLEAIERGLNHPVAEYHFGCGARLHRQRAELAFYVGDDDAALADFRAAHETFDLKGTVKGLSPLAEEEGAEGVRARELIARFRAPALALFSGIKGGDRAAVASALDAGAGANKAIDSFEDQAALIPLHYAASLGQSEIAELLIARGARVTRDDCKARARRHPLHYAAEHGAVALIERIIDIGEDVDISDEHGASPLMVAAAADACDGVSALLQAGAKATKPDLQGMTALHYAAKSDAVAAAKMLKKKSRGLLKKADRHGKVPADYASGEAMKAVFAGRTTRKK